MTLGTKVNYLRGSYLGGRYVREAVRDVGLALLSMNKAYETQMGVGANPELLRQTMEMIKHCDILQQMLDRHHARLTVRPNLNGGYDG